MKPLPPPSFNARPSRVASAQRADVAPTNVIVKHGAPLSSDDVDHLRKYNDWQGIIRRYARTLGIVRFSAGITADTIGRVTPRVEEYDPSGDWVESEDPRLIGLANEYRNPRQLPTELVRNHAWYYATVGELAMTMRDTPEGMEYGVWSMASLEWDKPEKDSVLVKFVPDGKIAEETAFSVPRKQVVRCWIPDEEWQAYATSPMAASVDDLKRLRSLTRHAQRQAESQLAMNGAFWMPDDDWPDDNQGTDDDESNSDVGTPQSLIEKMYYESAKLGFASDNDIAAIAPLLLHWAAQYGAPQSVEIGNPLDPNGIGYRDEARQDYARGTNLPASLVMGGGPGDANHWTEWLVDKKFFDSAIAPTADRIFHMDLTSTFLAPRLRVAGYEVGRYRMGYDPSPVIVEADQSDKAIPAWMAGLVGPGGALEMLGIDVDKKPTPEELDLLFSILAKQKAGASPFAKITMSKAGPSNVAPGVPSTANGNGAQPPTPTAVAAVLGEALLAMAGRNGDSH